VAPDPRVHVEVAVAVGRPPASHQK
jgi:hypothetical protein